MKDLQEINRLKNSKSDNIPFGNAYVCLIERLTDYYIDKLDGIERIKVELANWDEESKMQIVDDLKNNLAENYNKIIDFNEF